MIENIHNENRILTFILIIKLEKYNSFLFNSNIFQNNTKNIKYDYYNLQNW